MTRKPDITIACGLMKEFAESTGLDPIREKPKRYLWTDAFAVCNYLGFYEVTKDAGYQDLALRLINQVHHILGQYRDDDTRTGWISGLSSTKGEHHPKVGGLRIGKLLPEQDPADRNDDETEWNRDGQYFHYLTKWMHALNLAGKVSGKEDYLRWAVELARTAQNRFTYLTPGNRNKRMYWKMNVDLSRPIVSSMGQHDPLDGFLTYNELAFAAFRNIGFNRQQVLSHEIADIIGICRGMRLDTDDPLGIGGLLCDALRIADLTVQNGPSYPGLLTAVLESTLSGISNFELSGVLRAQPEYRLAFRELGLAIGLSALDSLTQRIEEEPDLPNEKDNAIIEDLRDYLPLRERIERFWLENDNRYTTTWMDHREINTVMLATSLAPDGFLQI